MSIKLDMQAGEGDHKDLDHQLKFDMAVYAQLNIPAKKRPGINYLALERKQKKLSKMKQKPDELFQDFVSQLMTTVGRHLRDSETEPYLKTVYMLSKK